MEMPCSLSLASTRRCGFVYDATLQPEGDRVVVACLPQLSVWIPPPAGLLHAFTDCHFGKGDAQRDDLVIREPRAWRVTVLREQLFVPLWPGLRCERIRVVRGSTGGRRVVLDRTGGRGGSGRSAGFRRRIGTGSSSSSRRGGRAVRALRGATIGLLDAEPTPALSRRA